MDLITRRVDAEGAATTVVSLVLTTPSLEPSENALDVESANEVTNTISVAPELDAASIDLVVASNSKSIQNLS